MSLDDDLNVDREIIAWRKVINVAGPGFSDTIRVEAKDRLELQPHAVEIDGLIFERYGDDEEHVEVRRDYVVARSVYPIFKTESLKATDLDLGVKTDAEELHRQERERG